MALFGKIKRALSKKKHPPSRHEVDSLRGKEASYEDIDKLTGHRLDGRNFLAEDEDFPSIPWEPPPPLPSSPRYLDRLQERPLAPAGGKHDDGPVVPFGCEPDGNHSPASECPYAVANDTSSWSATTSGPVGDRSPGVSKTTIGRTDSVVRKEATINVNKSALEGNQLVEITLKFLPTENSTTVPEEQNVSTVYDNFKRQPGYPVDGCSSVYANDETESHRYYPLQRASVRRRPVPTPRESLRGKRAAEAKSAFLAKPTARTDADITSTSPGDARVEGKLEVASTTNTSVEGEDALTMDRTDESDCRTPKRNMLTGADDNNDSKDNCDKVDDAKAEQNV